MRETIIIPIEPKPQSRPRATIRGRHATVYEDGKMLAWRKRVTDWIVDNYSGQYFDDAIKVDVTFYMPAPKTISEKPGPRAKYERLIQWEKYINDRLPCPKKPDLDNLEKALYDSISKSEIVWTDDNIIVEHTTRKMYSAVPRMKVRIEYL